MNNNNNYSAPEIEVSAIVAESLLCESSNGFNIPDYTDGEEF